MMWRGWVKPCGSDQFENETSGGSPLVDDCLVIIKDIEGDAGTDGPHRLLARISARLARMALVPLA